MPESPLNLNLSLNEFQEYKDKGFMVVDTRSPSEFSNSLIPGAVNVPYTSRFYEIAEALLFKDRGLILVAHQGQPEVEALKSAGFTNVAGYLEGGMQAWLEAGQSLDMVISIEPGEFALDFKHDDQLTVYDLRPALAFQQEHLTESLNRTPEDLLAELQDLHTNKTYYLICSDGQLSMGMTGLLKNRGYHNFYHVEGGFEATRDQEKIELTKPAKSHNKNQ